ncbi:MAG: hypothetical protein ACE5JS_08800 [Nitrospinota bacterium]
MKTIIVLLAILSGAGQDTQTHTYAFRLPETCQPGGAVAVASKEDYLAVVMRCVQGPDGRTFWIPAPKPQIPPGTEEEL